MSDALKTDRQTDKQTDRQTDRQTKTVIDGLIDFLEYSRIKMLGRNLV